MSCYISWNSQPSVLAASLEQKYGVELRDKVMSFINSETFILKYGDYKNSKPAMPVDTFGKEPTLDWVQANILNDLKKQPTINTKIAALKKVGRKYPRSLIKSEVRGIDTKGGWGPQIDSGFDEELDLPFQLPSKDLNKQKLEAQLKSTMDLLDQNDLDDATSDTLHADLQRLESQIKAIEGSKIEIKTRDIVPNRPIEKVILAEPTNKVDRSEIPSRDSMKARIKVEIVDKAINKPDKDILVDYANPRQNKFRQKSGYTQTQYAEILDELRLEMGENFPTNIKFHQAFETVMNNSPARIEQFYPETVNNQRWGIQDDVHREEFARLAIPVVDGRGTIQATFDEDFGTNKEFEITQFLTTLAFRQYLKDPEVSVSYLMTNLLKYAQQKVILNRQNNNEEGEDMWTAIVNAFAFKDSKKSFSQVLLDEFQNLGFTINDRVRGKINSDLFEAKGSELSGEISVDRALELEEGELFMEDIEDDTARGAADWSQLSFEVDPKRTASMRMKMWLATQDQVDQFGDLVRNSLGVASKTDLSTLFPKLMRVISNQPSGLSLERTIELLKADANPNVRETGRRLGELGEDIHIGNEFVKVFNMQYADYVILSSEITAEGHKTFPVSAQRTSQLQTTKDSWKENFNLSAMMVEGENGVKGMDVGAAKEHLVLVNAMKYVYEKPSESRTLNQIEADFNELIAPVKWMVEDHALEGLSIFRSLRKDEAGFKKDPKDKESYPERRVIISTIFKDIFESYGVNISQPAMEYLFRRQASRNENGQVEYTDKIVALTKDAKFNGNLKTQFSFTGDGKPNGMFSAFFAKAAGISDLNDVSEQDSSKVMENNPLYTETTTMNILAKVHNTFEDALYSDMHRSIEGKNIQDYIQHSSLSEAVIDMKKDFEAFKREHSKSELMSSQDGTIENNWHLSKMDPKKFKLKYLEGNKLSHKKKGVTRSNMSDREQTLTAVNLYLNKGKNVGHFMSMTHADKTYTPVFYNIPKLGVGNEWTGKRKDAVDALYSVFRGEYNRAKNAQRLIDRDGTTGDERFNSGSQKFLLVPLMNFESLEKLNKDLANKIYPNGELNTSLDLSTVKSEVSRLLYTHLESIADTQLEEFKREGITADMLDTDWLATRHKAYANDLKLTSYEKLKKAAQFEKSEQALKEIDKRKEILLKQAAREIGINNYLWNINSATMFFGDPAYTWKKTVDGTLAEYSKRLAKDLAPGLKLTWEPTNTTFRHITLKDSYEKDTFTKKMGGIYGEANATDAQEFTTVREHLDMMLAAGEIDKAVYDTFVSKIKLGQDYTFTDEEVAQLMKPLGPAKPVYTGFAPAKDGHRQYHYIKMSRYPLLPQFTKGLAIDNVRKLMENPRNNIQVASFESAVKMGAPKPIEVLNQDGSVDVDVAVLNSVVQTLERKNLRIQQDVPYKESKEQIRLVSQMNKLITSGLDFIQTPFMFQPYVGEGTEMDLTELKAKKRHIRASMAQHNLNRLKERMQKGGTWNSKALIQVLKDEAESRGYSRNEIALLETHLNKHATSFDLYLHPSSEKFESVLMALVKNIVTTEIPGKSYVQASSTGYQRENIKTEDQIDKNSIVYVGDYKGGRLQAMRRGENGETLPAQVLAPFNFFVKGPDGKKIKASIDDYLMVEGDDGYVNGQKRLNPAKVPNELLELVGARIPNQGHSSMIPIQIVGFVPNALGDLLIVPSDITRQMGSDFDVDKLFTYKRSYRETEDGFEVMKDGKLTMELGENVDHKIVIDSQVKQRLLDKGVEPNEEGKFPRTEYNEILSSVLKEMYGENEVPRHPVVDTEVETLEQLQRDYFDVHWAVLSHPEMYDKIRTSLDKPDLGELNELYSTSSNQAEQYWSGHYQRQMFQKGKDAKTLVGLTSLGVTFNPLVEDKNIKLGTYYIVEKQAVEDLTPLEIGKYTLTEISGFGKSKHSGREYSKEDNLIMYQSAAVDNAKDRHLDNLNITIATWPAIQALHQMQTKSGEALPVQYVVSMMVQESLVEYSSRMRQSGDSLSTEYKPDLSNDILTELKTKWEDTWQKANPDKVLREELDKVSITQSELQSAWERRQKNEEKSTYALLQLKTLDAFEQALKYGQRIGELQKTLNQDTKGAGPNFIYANQQAENYNEIFSQNLSKIFVGEDQIVNETEQQDLFDMAVGTANEIGQLFFPTRELTALTQQLSEYTQRSYKDISIDTQRELLRAYKTSVLSSTGMLSEDPQADRFRLLFDTEESPSLAARLIKFKEKNTDNYFLNRLQTKTQLSSTGPHYVTWQSAKSVHLNDALVQASFVNMLYSDNEVEQELGRDLIKYAILVSGQAGGNSFMSQIPTVFLVGSNFTREIARFGTMDKETLLQQFIQHNPSQAFTIDDKVLEGNNFAFKVENSYPEILSFKAKDVETLQYIDENGEQVPVPYLSYYSKEEQNTVLYKLRQTGATIQYQRIDVLGNGFTQEYNPHDTRSVQRSIHSKNRAANEFQSADISSALDSQAMMLIDRASNLSDELANWGLIEQRGGEQELTRMLDNMESDATLENYYRNMVKFMRPTAKTSPLLRTLKKYGLVEKQLTYEVDKAMDASGDYNPMQRKMRLSGRGSKTDNAETILHELGHHQISDLAMALGWIDEAAVREQLGDKYDQFAKEFADTVAENQKANPELYKQLKRLDMLRLQALNALPADASEELRYAMSDIHEFAAHVRTNKETMAFLNTVESTGKSLFERIWDAITDMLDTIADFIGMPVNKRSILAESYTIVHNITSVGDNVRTDNKVLNITTEYEANSIASTIQSVEQRITQLEDKGTHYNVNITMNKVEAKTVHSGVDFAAAKMKRQLQMLESVIATTPRTDEDKARIRRAEEYYREVSEDLSRLEASADLEEFQELGLKQLSWVKRTLDKENPHLQELFMAHELMDLWLNLNNVYKTDSKTSAAFDEVIDSLSGDAARMFKDVNKAVIKGLQELGRNEGVTLTASDLTDGLKTVSGVEDWALTASRDINKAVQLMTKVVQRAAQIKQEETLRLKGELDEMIEKLEEYGKTSPLSMDDIYKKFIQENDKGTAFGLVQYLKPEWYTRVYEADKNLTKELRGVNNKFSFKTAQGRQYAAKYRKAAYAKFWKKMEGSSIIGVNLMFNEETGARIQKGDKNYAQAQAEYDRLVAYSGNATLVDQAIEKSAKVLEQYVLKRDDHKAELERSIELDANLTEEEAKKSKAEKVALKLSWWENTMSPFRFVRTSSNKESDSVFQNLGYNIPAFVPKVGAMMDPKYKEIQENTQLKDVYETLVKMSKKYRSYLPPNKSKYLHDNFLPVLNHDDVTTFMETLRKVSVSKAGRKAINSLMINQDQFDARNDPKDKIPIRYTGKPQRNEDGSVDFSKVSTNLPRMFEMFGNMAIHFKNLQPTEHLINIIENTIKEESEARIDSGDRKGLTSLASKIQYYKDFHLYDRARDLELIKSTPVYSLKPWKDAKIKAEIESLLEEKNKLEQEQNDKSWISKLDEKHPTNVRLAEIQTRLNEIYDDKKYFVGSKLTDKLIAFNQLKSMAFNPFSAVTNLTFGWLSAATHARGFRVTDKETKTTSGDYTIKQLKWAVAEMKSNVAASWGSIAGYRGNKTAAKIRAIVDKVGLIDVLIDTTYGKGTNLSPAKRSALKRTFDPFAAQYSGDFLMKGAVVLAMMKNKMIETENGKVSLYDAMDENGNWNEAEYGENKKWYSEKVEEQDEWNTFKGKVRKVGILIFGNQDSMAPLAARKQWWGRLVGQFRLSWVPEGINTRWGRQYEDAELGRTIEGRYKTLFRLKGKGLSLMYKQAMSAITGADPFEGVTTLQNVLQANGTYEEQAAPIQDFEKENIRRNLTGIGYTVVASALVFALTAALKNLGDDDEDEKRALTLALNMIVRTQQDLLFYSDPFTAEQFLGNVVPSMNVMTDFRKALMYSPGFFGDDKERAKATRAALKSVPFLTNINKFRYHTERNLADGVR